MGGPPYEPLASCLLTSNLLLYEEFLLPHCPVVMVDVTHTMTIGWNQNGTTISVTVVGLYLQIHKHAFDRVTLCCPSPMLEEVVTS